MNNQPPSSTWNLLTDEQRSAILAFTHDAPDDQPSGRVEGAIEQLTEGLSEQVDALRLAFGLVDAVAPTIEESERLSERAEVEARTEIERLQKGFETADEERLSLLDMLSAAGSLLPDDLQYLWNEHSPAEAVQRLLGQHSVSMDAMRTEIERLKKELHDEQARSIEAEEPMRERAERESTLLELHADMDEK